MATEHSHHQCDDAAIMAGESNPFVTTEEEKSDLTASILAVGQALLNGDSASTQHDASSSSSSPCSFSEDRIRQADVSATTQLMEEPLLLRRRNVPARNEGDQGSDRQPQSSPRILDRDGAFHQSRGKWSVERRSRGVRMHRTPDDSSQYYCRRLCISKCWDSDWFHNLAYKPTLVLMAILFLIYALTVFFFAFVYLGVSKLGAPRDDDGGSIHHSFCGMDINNHMEALYFSLSTMTTIGYGVSDYYFGDCWTPLLLVLCQSCAAITFSAIAIGLLFQRISRGQKRTKTILFSDKALVRRVRGVPYLMFRVGELRRHHLIEASVRAYCLRHERLPTTRWNGDQHFSNVNAEQESHGARRGDEGRAAVDIETTHYLARHMELIHPDETVGSHILMSLPQVIVHRMDGRSPLVPPRPVWYDKNGRGHQSAGDEVNTSSFADGYGDLEEFLRDRDAEIIVLLEGTDELTGSAIQARHSYRADDICWDYKFAPCVFPTSPSAPTQDEEGGPSQSRQLSWPRRRNYNPRRRPHSSRGGSSRAPVACTVDFAKFHSIVRVPPDCDACAFVPQ